MNNPLEVAMKLMKEAGMDCSTNQMIKYLDCSSRQTFNNYLKNPGQIPLEKLMNLSIKTGISLDVLLGAKEPQEGPRIPSAYASASRCIEESIKEIESTKEMLETINIDSSLSLCEEKRAEAKKDIADLSALARIQRQKPTVCAFGPSDVGKSTFINYLVGESVLPTGYSPMTSVPMKIMHKSEKPEDMLEEVDDTVVFGRKKGKKNAEISAIRTGNHNSILQEFGTHEGEYFKKSSWEVHEIHVYIDSPVLEELTIVDVPGFDTGLDSGHISDDVSLTMDAGKFDIVFCLSTADAFLRSKEIAAVSNILRTREDLSSMYILATHAKSIDIGTDRRNSEELDKILRAGCERIVDSMSEREKKRLGISKGDYEKLRERCFEFDINDENFCSRLNGCIEKEVPEIVEKKYNIAARMIKDVADKYHKRYSELNGKNKKKKRTQTKKSSDNADDALKNAVKHYEIVKRNLEKSLNEKWDSSLEEMGSSYKQVMSKEFITKAIEDKKLKNKAADIEILTNYLNEELNDRLQKCIEKRSEDFCNEINEELKEFAKKIDVDVKKLDIDVGLDAFDVERFFWAGLSGPLTYGALSAFAAIVAGGSNLGAYILVAKVVSLLGGLGISVGGTAAAISTVAAIGGPVTIGVSLAILASAGIFGALTGNWKDRLAKRLGKAYEKGGILEEYKSSIRDYWNDTDKELKRCLDSLFENIKKMYEGDEKKAGMSSESIISTDAILQTVYGGVLKCCEKVSDLCKSTY